MIGEYAMGQSLMDRSIGNEQELQTIQTNNQPALNQTEWDLKAVDPKILSLVA